jgi:flavin-binding protein dodecin
MIISKKRDYTGFSEESLNEAIANALEKAKKHSHFEIIEARSSQFADNKRHYHVTLATFCD